MRIIPAVLFLTAVPALASSGDQRLILQKGLFDEYVSDARLRLASAREQLEILQEFGLTPHSSDEPVEAALLHLDLAEGYLASSLPGLEPLASASPAQDHWTPFAERKDEALRLLRGAAPDLAAAYEGTPVRAAALGGKTMAEFHYASREVRIRGYFAVNAASPEFLAARLAHEAVHALQYSSASISGTPTVSTREEELEARRRETQVWQALGAKPELDWGGQHGAQLKALLAGDEEFRKWTVDEQESAPDWSWTQAAVSSAPVPAGAVDASSLTYVADSAVMVPRLKGTIAILRANFATAAQQHLERAQDILGTLPELALPCPKLVTYDVMKLWVLQPAHYPRALNAVFEALHPVMTELDRSRAWLGAAAIDEAERGLLANYGGERNRLARPLDDAARAVVERWVPGAPPLFVYPYPGSPPRLADGAAGLPGAWQSRGGRPEIAAAWAAHLAAHRKQGLAPGSMPTAAQEEEAVRRALEVWRLSGANTGFDGGHPDRFLFYRLLDEAGGDALAYHLKSSGFAQPAPIRRRRAASNSSSK
ncbi:MAG: hypothetical protein PHU21_10155 [Elusimicrobia bacterium]|nr:hypothetical protein [Elusimicrobiota bacterium]